MGEANEGVSEDMTEKVQVKDLHAQGLRCYDPTHRPDAKSLREFLNRFTKAWLSDLESKTTPSTTPNCEVLYRQPGVMKGGKKQDRIKLRKRDNKKNNSSIGSKAERRLHMDEGKVSGSY